MKDSRNKRIFAAFNRLILAPAAICFALLLLWGSPASAETFMEAFKNKYTGPPISLHVQETDISSVLNIFQELLKVNIVSGKGVTGKIRSLLFVNVPMDQAFNTFLRSHDLYSVKYDNVITVYNTKDYVEDLHKRLGK